MHLAAKLLIGEDGMTFRISGSGFCRTRKIEPIQFVSYCGWGGALRRVPWLAEGDRHLAIGGEEEPEPPSRLGPQDRARAARRVDVSQSRAHPAAFGKLHPVVKVEGCS